MGEGYKEIIRFADFDFLLERRKYEPGLTKVLPPLLMKFQQHEQHKLFAEISPVENQNANLMMIF
jgi:hypothetical protein